MARRAAIRSRRRLQLVGQVEAGLDERTAVVEDDGGGLGVGPDVELGHRGAVADRGAAAHQRDAGDAVGQVGRPAQRQRDVGQRSGRHQPHALPGAGGLDDEGHRVARPPPSARARGGRRRPGRSRRGRSRRGRAWPAAAGPRPGGRARRWPRRSRMTSALRVVRSSGALPATVVTPSSSVWRAATTSAIASSWPGSQSTMTGTAIGGLLPSSGVRRAARRRRRG